MAHNGDIPDEELQARNPHASATRWRHQESSAFARHAVQQQQAGHHQKPREPENRGNTSDLANFLNSSRVSPEETVAAAAGSGSGSRSGTADGGGKRFTPIVVGAAEAREATAAGEPGPEDAEIAPDARPDGKEIVCGPLINYRRQEGTTWVGSVLVVTKGGGKTQESAPTLLLRYAGERQAGGAAAAAAAVEGAGAANGGASASGGAQKEEAEFKGVCLYSDPRNTFWRFSISCEILPTEGRWEYTLPGLRFHSRTKPQTNAFYVPAAAESMRIMFHSCNGFSVGTDEDAYSGACLWNDVNRRHAEAPFHVMIGGGDQIYNDGIRVNGPLRQWTDIGNPKKRKDYPFPESLRQECDDYYLKNYIRWYSTEPFATANGQIPQLNIWDDHDIIDGFGSYVNDFMKCDVFRGIGGTAHKYYMLFQHHLPPPPSTYTTDAPQTTGASVGNHDPNQLMDVYVAEEMTEPNYIVGNKPGPYVAEKSHNMFASLGARIAFLGIDARTERTRHQINYPETYDLIFNRLDRELTAARERGQPFKHLILLLGIPIAYPRLTWLENVFSSPVIGPIKFLNRRFGLGGGVFNHFDGSVDLLDDLDDHYTARTHKKERNHLVERLQSVCAQHSVRTTILGGDVHLAALGRFYSNPKLRVPTEKDHRYMVNVVSSAIVNKPPPPAIANLLARRNKIHHLNHDTDETLLRLFNKDPGDSDKTAGHNQVTMPSRNFAVITENSPNNAPSPDIRGQDPIVNDFAPPFAPALQQQNGGGSSGPSSLAPPSSRGGADSTRSGLSSHSNNPAADGGDSDNKKKKNPPARQPSSTKVDGHYPIGAGEQGAGTHHKAASPAAHGRGHDGSLDVCIRVEIDQHDREGRTEAYGLSIPALEYEGPHVPSPGTFRPSTRGSSAAGSAAAPATGVEGAAGGGSSSRPATRS
ncbi:uncharacterized protein E0L32_003640 [Thyridium curvatum]|uniref:PhoD-like phosphatase domain-containing protein n=1 Tax=Thyridium curvatum TaxID=1093900 RepID=A0A507BHA0_9PEZI|nr:uncharacterized protein E0L32_003640 [Thyridium curvatum]TPX16699.1 hypothetical protein E0L32_003640 [Thyridium curvatum]